MEQGLHKMQYLYETCTKIRTLPFTDDQVIIADSEDNLQRGILTLQNVAKNFGMEMPPGKSEMMAFLGQDPLRYKSMVDNKCLQHVKNFEYLSCEVSYENEKDIQQNLAKFAPILGIVSNTFKPYLVQKFSRKRVYNALAVPICLYGSEICTL